MKAKFREVKANYSYLNVFILPRMIHTGGYVRFKRFNFRVAEYAADHLPECSLGKT